MVLKIDMHTHSCYSNDGVSKPRELLQIASKNNFGFAITEHNNGDSWKQYWELNKKFKVPLICGEEIKLNNSGKFVGELLFYFLQKPIKSRELFTAIDEARAQDALISVAHPFDIFRKPILFGFRELEAVKKKIDAIEVFNSRVYFRSINRRAQKFAEANNLAFSAGSDSHIPRELGNAMAVCEGNSLEDFRKAIKKRQTRVEGKLSPITVHFYSTLKNFGIIKSNKGD
ncbi:MAG: PHP domain-containing protein [Candidatus Diapherotrites archaeon]|nr:PHP domain-containing protein [Candidatus Diapherotrites archaeon]